MSRFPATTRSAATRSWPRSTGPILRHSSAYVDMSASSVAAARSWTKWTASIESAGSRSSLATRIANGKEQVMPTIIVMSNEGVDKSGAVVFAENVQPERLASDHHTAQLIERVEWAVIDAKEAEE